MLQAQLKGKLGRDEESLEDLLTSNVFGVFSYLEPSDGLLPFLRRAEGPLATELRDWLAAGPGLRAAYEFWPRIALADCHGCEPDVVVRLERADGAKAILVIEAKYRSGKSSQADPGATGGERPFDQLARQWDNLARLAQDEGARPFLVYVTAGYTYPRSDLEASQAELVKLRAQAGTMLWLSWRALANAAIGTAPILVDLRRLMRDRYGLTFFEGVHVTTVRLPWDASFASAERPDVRCVVSPASNAGGIEFDWSAARTLAWRFIP